MKAFLSALLLLWLQSVSVRAQSTASPQQPPQHPSRQAETTDAGEEPDDNVVTPPVPEKPRSVQENVNLAWQMLEQAIALGKVQSRIDAVNAIGTMTTSPHAETMVARTIKDPERDVRLATVIAMSDMRGPATLSLLRQALTDNALDVSFAAATVLWKRGDHSGEDNLSGVLIGHRKASAGFLGHELHAADRDLHNPAALGAIGAEQGAYALLGPFGIGLDVLKVMRGKGPSGDSARVIAADLLAKDASPVSLADFLAVINDKDYFVRIAAARALGAYHGKDVNEALLSAFSDPKPAVRYVSAASYIRANSSAPSRGTKPVRRAAPPPA